MRFSLAKTARCSSCKRVLSVASFGSDRNNPGGRAHRCSECDRERAREYYRRNREKVIARTSAASRPRKDPKPCRNNCGRMAPSALRWYCDECRVATAERRQREKERKRLRSRGTPEQRGYGKPHQRERAAWEPVVATGTVRCARGADCKFGALGLGGFIRPGDAWDLGHRDDDRSRYAGPEHAACNRATASRRARRVSVRL